jgi:vacuolar protein sorting-associated protein 16
MEVTWCGEDAVVLLWKNTGIVMVGPYGDWLNYPYDGAVALVSEPDCCRIVTSSSCEMLQRVPPSTEAIKRIGSTDPAALLYDAMEGFLEGDPKSDENIRSIASTNQLQYAVKSCINAASAEFDVSRQQALFRAASYGKAFCQNLDPTEFVETAKKLRVLNDVRREEIGLPLTMQQYVRLTPEVLVNRLTMRNHHYLALRICELLKLKNESVLIHWASEKVKKLTATPATDEEIAMEIKFKLQKYDRMSYLEVAAAAYHMGRRRLATILLDNEQHAADQVPLLLSMQEEELALRKAVNSEDTDLIYLTLIHLERSRPDAEAFYRLVYTHPEAANLLKIYYRNKATATDRALLHNLLIHSRNFYEAGVACMNQSYQQDSFPKKLQLVKEAIQLFAQNRDLSVYKSATEEQMDLMEIQKALEVRSSRDFIGLSLSETLANIFLLNVEKPDEAQRWNQEATRIIKKFKVSEKMVWSLKVDCFSKTGQWELLSKLAAEKRSPIGYKPFALACKKYVQLNRNCVFFLNCECLQWWSTPSRSGKVCRENIGRRGPVQSLHGAVHVEACGRHGIPPERPAQSAGGAPHVQRPGPRATDSRHDRKLIMNLAGAIIF